MKKIIILIFITICIESSAQKDTFIVFSRISNKFIFNDAYNVSGILFYGFEYSDNKHVITNRIHARIVEFVGFKSIKEVSFRQIIKNNTDTVSFYNCTIDSFNYDSVFNYVKVLNMDRCNVKSLPNSLFKNNHVLVETAIRTLECEFPNINHIMSLQRVKIELENPYKGNIDTIFDRLPKNLSDIEVISGRYVFIKELRPKFSNLNTISIRFNTKFTLCKNIKALKNIDTIRISNCKIHHIPKELYLLGNVKVLALNNNNIRKIHKNTFNNMPSLKIVYLMGNRISRKKQKRLIHDYPNIQFKFSHIVETMPLPQKPIISY